MERSASHPAAWRRWRRGRTKSRPIPARLVERGRGRRWCPRPSTRSHPVASAQAPVFLNEDGGGAVHAGSAGQRAGHDLAGLPDRLERPAFDFAAQRIEQLVARLRDAAADDHDFGIEDVHEARHRGAEQRGRIAHDLERPFVAVVRRLVDDLRGQLREIALHVLRQRRLRARLNAFDRAFGDGRPRRVRFDASVVAALAMPPIGVDAHMAEFGGRVADAAIDVAVDDDAAADARAERQADDIIRRARSGMLVQPRFGVSSTMPVLVFSGPGDPIPTPSTFLPDSLIDALASLMMRPMTGSAPCAASVGSDTPARISDPSSARTPATRLVPPTSIPTT